MIAFAPYITQRLARLAAHFGPPPAPVLERRSARGVIDRSNPGMRRIVVTIDEATFNRIGDAAAAADVSQSEAIRQIIARGLGARSS